MTNEQLKTRYLAAEDECAVQESLIEDAMHNSKVAYRRLESISNEWMKTHSCECELMRLKCIHKE